MAAMSDYLENKLLDYVFRAQAFSAPATTYVALFTSAPSDSSGGTEATGTGYARVGVTSGLTQWLGTAGTTSVSAGTTGTITNAAAVTFGSPVTGWGLITHFGIYDASTSGNLLFLGALTTSKTVGPGDAAPSFGVSQLSIQIDN